ncbi:MAG: hypothetical protein JXN65_10420 [Clostridia bacterium]|nr:hypothetical protein [Clostridia bacterium]
MNQKDSWKLLADEMGGNYIATKLLKVPKVELNYKSFRFLIDTYTVSTGKSTITYTRMRTVFINKEEFRFKIYKEGFFQKIAKALGMPDIEIGDAQVDDKLIIKSPVEYLAVDLFSKPSIKEMLIGVKNLNLSVEKKFYDNTEMTYKESVLNQTVTGVVKDIEILKSWYNLFSAIIDGMIELNITEDTEPQNALV